MIEKDKVSPPLTTLTVNIGVVGHSASLVTQDSVLITQIREIFKEIKKIVLEIHSASGSLFNNRKPLLRVVSALSDEAERLVVKEAINLNYDLQCPLPFSRGESKEMVRGPGKVDLDSILKKASAILEMDGTAENAGNAAFAARQVVLKQSDILLFVTDASEEKSSPGEFEKILEEAKHNGIPLLWIDTRDIQNIKFLSQQTGLEWKGALKKQLNQILNPFEHDKQPPAKRPKPMHERYFSEKRKRWNYGFFYKFLIDLVSFRKPKIKIRNNDFESLTRDQWRKDWATSPNLPTDVIEKVEDGFLSHYSWADNLAVYYASLYRTAFISRYLFGVLVILGVFVGFYGSPSIQHIGFAAESVFILTIIFLTKFGNYRGWHERFLDYRFLAELIRHMRYLALLGDVMPSARFPVYNVHENSTWVNWHFRNIIREAGLIKANVTKDYLKSLHMFLKDCEIKNQIEFYEKNTKEFNLLSNRLERIGWWCYYAGLGAVLCRALVYVYGYLGYETLNPSVERGKNYFNQIASIIPAIAPVLWGIKSQGEFARLAKRYAAMKAQLVEINQGVENIEGKLSSKNLRQFAEEAANIMINEVSDWKVLLKARPISMI